MSKARRLSTILGFVLGTCGVAVGQPREPWVEARTVLDGEASVGGATRPLLKASVPPPQFGTQDHEVRTLSAARFFDVNNPTLSGYCPDGCPNGFHRYAGFEVPAGMVIDYIGANTRTTVDGALGFALHLRDHLGGTAMLASHSIPAHPSFSTDYSGPLGILVPSNVDRVFVLELAQAPGLADSEQQYFGFFEVGLVRIVSEPPATPTFGDVPPSHPQYQFIEALAASGITGGCGGGNFCPEAPLKRGQMAAFLAKALGLHWPN